MADQITGTVISWATVVWHRPSAGVFELLDLHDTQQDAEADRREYHDSRRVAAVAVVEPDDGLPGRARPSLADIQARYDQLQAAVAAGRTSGAASLAIVATEISTLAWALGIHSTT